MLIAVPTAVGSPNPFSVTNATAVGPQPSPSNVLQNASTDQLAAGGIATGNHSGFVDETRQQVAPEEIVHAQAPQMRW